MLIKNEFEVAEPVEKVWQFFENIPQVAARQLDQAVELA